MKSKSGSSTSSLTLREPKEILEETNKLDSETEGVLTQIKKLLEFK